MKQSDLLGAALAHIQNESPLPTRIDFRFLQSNWIDESNLLEIMRNYGFYCSRFSMHKNWYAVINGLSFDEYYNKLASRVRNTIRRKENKLILSNKHHVIMSTDPGVDLDTLIRDYIIVYNKSWKTPEPFPEFIPSITKLANQLGILRLGVMYINNIPAAAQLWITANSVATIYKLAYDENFREFSPGSILSRLMFQHAIDNDRVSEIDFCVGNEAYKKDWMTDVRYVDGIVATNTRSLPGCMATMRLWIGDVAKQRIFRGRQLPSS